jgi:hypothetical protein
MLPYQQSRRVGKVLSAFGNGVMGVRVTVLSPSVLQAVWLS